jgi:hypothetical protein
MSKAWTDNNDNNQPQAESQMAALIPVKSWHVLLIPKKQPLLRNTATYACDWHCHLVSDAALLLIKL